MCSTGNIREQWIVFSWLLVALAFICSGQVLLFLFCCSMPSEKSVDCCFGFYFVFFHKFIVLSGCSVGHLPGGAAHHVGTPEATSRRGEQWFVFCLAVDLFFSFAQVNFAAVACTGCCTG